MSRLLGVGFLTQLDDAAAAFIDGLRSEANPFPQYALTQVGELAYAENITGTATTVGAGATVDVASVVVAVPVCASPVYLSAAFTFSATAGAVGSSAIISIAEVSNGVDTPITETQATPCTGAGLVASCNIVPFRLAASTARVRTFKLQAASIGTAAFTTVNGTSNRSYLAAEAR